MKLTRLTKLAMTGAIALTFGLSAPSANAQTTENVTASATVQNGFTVAEVNGLLFGKYRCWSSRRINCAGPDCNGHQYGDPSSYTGTANRWHNSIYT